METDSGLTKPSMIEEEAPHYHYIVKSHFPYQDSTYGINICFHTSSIVVCAENPG